VYVASNRTRRPRYERRRDRSRRDTAGYSRKVGSFFHLINNDVCRCVAKIADPNNTRNCVMLIADSTHRRTSRMVRAENFYAIPNRTLNRRDRINQHPGKLSDLLTDTLVKPVRRLTVWISNNDEIRFHFVSSRVSAER